MARHSARATSRDLDTPVEIQSPPAANSSGNQDAYGGTAPASWPVVATPYASVEAIGGTELAIASRTTAQAIYRVRMRRRTDLTVKHRLRVIGGVYTGAILNVQTIGVAQGARGELLEVVCIRTV
jgi:head-tail adaptor